MKVMVNVFKTADGKVLYAVDDIKIKPLDSIVAKDEAVAEVARYKKESISKAMSKYTVRCGTITTGKCKSGEMALWEVNCLIVEKK